MIVNEYFFDSGIQIIKSIETYRGFGISEVNDGVELDWGTQNVGGFSESVQVFEIFETFRERGQSEISVHHVFVWLTGFFSSPQ